MRAETDAVVYLRQSLDRTGEELGVRRQREDARKLADARGLRVVREVVDNDVSASGRRVRPGFEQVLALLDSGEASCVIAWDMTRLTRNSRDSLRLFEVGKRHGVTLVFCRGSEIDLGTPAGRLTAEILSSVARHEIDQKADRQRRAALQAAEQGRRIGGRRPFGYDADGVTVREDEAAAIRDGFEAVLAGVPLAKVAADWNDRGLRTPQRGHVHGCDGACAPNVRPRQCPARRLADEPNRWTAQTVRPVLLNPRYAGLRAYVPQTSLDRGADPRRARVDGVVAAAVWPELVSEETWRATVETLTNPDRTRSPRSARGLLTGVALCSVCGSTVHRGGAATTTSYPTYRCSGSTGHVARNAAPVDWYVAELVIERLSRPDAARLLADDTRPDARKLGREARDLRRRLDNLAGLLADGTLTETGVRREAAKLRERLAEVEREQSDAGRVDVLGPLVGAPDVRAVWDALSTDRRRAIINVLMTVKVRPPGRGARVGKTVPEWQAHAARIAATVDVDWL